MKCSYSEQPYQWQDGEAWHVGRLVETPHPITGTCKITLDNGIFYLNLLKTDWILIRHNHTNALEFVEWGKLLPYPQGVIEEPTNTGKAVEGE